MLFSHLFLRLYKILLTKSNAILLTNDTGLKQRHT